MDIIVKIMDRNPDLTVITIDEIDQSNWIIAGKPVDKSKHHKVCYIENSRFDFSPSKKRAKFNPHIAVLLTKVKLVTILK